MNSVCVFCGSNSGAGEAYADAARRLARALVARRLKVVYGGGSIGLMGVLGDAVLAAGGQVIGVTPRRLLERELVHKGLTEQRFVKPEHRAMLITERDPETLLDRLSRARPPQVSKWMDRTG